MKTTILFLLIIVGVVITAYNNPLQAQKKQKTTKVFNNKRLFKKKIKAGAVVIDVRTQKEYDAGHIEGAILIPHNEIASIIETLIPDKNAEILLYCRSGGRSGKATKTITEIGYKNALNAGGYEKIK